MEQSQIHKSGSRILVFTLILTLVSCNKKDDPKPTTPAPAPITSASTSFNIKSSAYIKLLVGDNLEIRNYTGANTPKADTTTTKTITSQNITFSLTGQITAQYPVTLTINSGHKSYTFVDSTNKGVRSVALW